MNRAVCLVSGGMDSCVAAARVIEQGFDAAFLHVSYRQRTQNRELRAFQQIADFYSVEKRLICDVSHLHQIGGSALTDPSIRVPDGNLSRTQIPSSYVPFRNANLLSMGVAWAEAIRAKAVCIGAVEEDSSGYPDCRIQFFEAFQRAVDRGTRPETDIRILTPVIHLEKKEIVLEAVRLSAPLELTWSCYQNEAIACGKCDSCLLRLRGFAEAGQRDPTAYANRNNAVPDSTGGFTE